MRDERRSKGSEDSTSATAISMRLVHMKLTDAAYTRRVYFLLYSVPLNTTCIVAVKIVVKSFNKQQFDASDTETNGLQLYCF